MMQKTFKLGTLRCAARKKGDIKMSGAGVAIMFCWSEIRKSFLKKEVKKMTSRRKLVLKSKCRTSKKFQDKIHLRQVFIL